MPSANQPPTPQVTELINRLAELEDALSDLREENKVRYETLRELEQDDEITEETREGCIYALKADIGSAEEEIYNHEDEIEEINAILEAMGYGVETSD
ncbi:hypothetical protein C7212DRAFT_323807 [Tuber magnatum]|uniref:Uncharacterized protein n=1 Tax=Tuber magnatum TaxID=42249 RepID=A0A317SVR3_9PEZI|nr:hypothetical protein C7212DRAFT_323807 [Tuber magnatum]